MRIASQKADSNTFDRKLEESSVSDSVETQQYSSSKSQNALLLDNDPIFDQGFTSADDELSFTNFKLAKEIEMKISTKLREGMISHGRIRQKHQSSLIFIWRFQKTLLMASIIQQWARRSSISRAVVSVLNCIAIGSYSERVKVVLESISKNVRGSYLASNLGLGSIVAVSFRLFSPRNSKRARAYLSEWYQHVLHKRRISRILQKPTLRFRKMFGYRKAILLAWVLCWKQRRFCYLVMASKLDKKQRIRNHHAFIHWRKYTMIEHRNFRIGSRTYEKYLTGILKSALISWRDVYDNNWFYRLRSKMFCRKRQLKLVQEAILKWLFWKQFTENQRKFLDDHLKQSSEKHFANSSRHVSSQQLSNQTVVNRDQSDLASLLIVDRPQFTISHWERISTHMDQASCCENTCKVRIYLPYTFRSLQRGIRAWRDLTMQIRHICREVMLISKRTLLKICQDCVASWLLFLLSEKTVARKVAKFEFRSSRKLRFDYFLLWANFCQFHLSLRSKLYVDRQGTEHSLITISNKYNWENGDGGMVKEALDRCMKRANLIKEKDNSQGSAELLIIMEIEYSSISNLDELKALLVRLVATASDMDPSEFLVTEIGGGKWTSAQVRVVHAKRLQVPVDEWLSLLRVHLVLRRKKLDGSSYLKIRWVGTRTAEPDSPVALESTIDQVLPGRPLVKVRVFSKEGGDHQRFAFETMLQFCDPRSQFSKEAVFQQVQYIDVRTVREKGDRYQLRLLRSIVKKWSRTIGNRDVRGSSKYLDSLGLNVLYVRQNLSVKHSLSTWKGYVRGNKMWWSRRRKQISKDPGLSSEKWRMQLKMESSVPTSPNYEGNLKSTTLHSLNAWRDVVKHNLRMMRAMRISTTRSSSRILHFCVSQWHLCCWLQHARKRKQVILSSKFKMQLLNTFYFSWKGIVKLLCKVKQRNVIARVKFLLKAFGMWFCIVKNEPVTISSPFHRFFFFWNQTSRHIFCSTFSVWKARASHSSNRTALKRYFDRRRWRSELYFRFSLWRRSCISKFSVDNRELDQSRLSGIKRKFFTDWLIHYASTFLLPIFGQGQRALRFMLCSQRAKCQKVRLVTIGCYLERMDSLQIYSIKDSFLSWSELHLWGKWKLSRQAKMQQSRCYSVCLRAFRRWTGMANGQKLFDIKLSSVLFTAVLKCFLSWRQLLSLQTARRNQEIESVENARLQLCKLTLLNFQRFAKQRRRLFCLIRKVCDLEQRKKKKSCRIAFNCLQIRSCISRCSKKFNLLALKRKIFQNKIDWFNSFMFILPQHLDLFSKSVEVIMSSWWKKSLFHVWKLHVSRLKHVICIFGRRQTLHRYSTRVLVFLWWSWCATISSKVAKSVSVFECRRDKARKVLSLTNMASYSGMLNEKILSIVSQEAHVISKELYNTSVVRLRFHWFHLSRQICVRKARKQLFSHCSQCMEQRIRNAAVTFIGTQNKWSFLDCCLQRWRSWPIASKLIHVIETFIRRKRLFWCMRSFFICWIQITRSLRVDVAHSSTRQLKCVLYSKHLASVSWIAKYLQQWKTLATKGLVYWQRFKVLSCHFCSMLYRQAHNLSVVSFVRWKCHFDFQVKMKFKRMLSGQSTGLLSTFWVAWRDVVRFRRLLVVSGIRVMLLQRRYHYHSVMKKWNMVRVGRKFHRLLFSRLTRLGRKYLLLKIISGWQNFIFDQFHSVRDSGLLCQNVGRCEGNPRQTDCVDFPLQIKSRNEVIKALKARDLLIEKSSRETARLNSIIEEKDQIIFKREQSISIRDKWLEQLSIESQFKDSIIGKIYQKVGVELTVHRLTRL